MPPSKKTEQDQAEEPQKGAPFRLHGDLLSTTLLAFLRNWNAYGYQLSQQLNQAGLPAFDSGTVYRTLRQLEKSGLVSSFWDTSESGPARRMYSLTSAGDIFLSGWIDVLSNYQRVLRTTLERINPDRVRVTADDVDEDVGAEDVDDEAAAAYEEDLVEDNATEAAGA